ncbi:MAG: hypothetical protein LBM41_01130 [Ruminococcus sp.]|jgi:hypothetical protein|nr:hypothetical protein [Ruminococcus sp.]
MIKRIFLIFLLIMLCGCNASTEPFPEVICNEAETTTTAAVTTTTAAVSTATTQFIPTFSPSPIIAEDVSEDGALKLSVKMHDDEFVTFEKITATVTLENLTDEDYNFVFGGGGVVDNKPPLYCGFWTDAEYETLAYPMLSNPITFTPGQILTNTIEFTPNYKETGERIFFADMPYSKDGERFFLSIEPIKFNVIFRYVNGTTIDSTAPKYSVSAEERDKNSDDPDQDYKTLPFSDDFSDKEFSYRYLGSCYYALWEARDGRLVVDAETTKWDGQTVIGNYGWSYYNAAIDFNIQQDGFIQMWVYARDSGDFDGDCYAITINSDGSYYAGDSRGIHDYRFGYENQGILITGQFEDFNPDVWNRISMLSEDGKLYISLNSGEKIYVCDLDPNAAGAIKLEASSGTEFDNLEIVSAE